MEENEIKMYRDDVYLGQSICISGVHLIQRDQNR